MKGNGMHFFTKIIIGNVISRVTGDLYKNKHKISELFIRKNKDPIQRIFDKIAISDAVQINLMVFKILGFINEEEEKLIYLQNTEVPYDDEYIYDLNDPEDVEILSNAKYFKLTEIKD